MDRNQPLAEPLLKGKWYRSHDIFEVLTQQHNETRSLFATLSEISDNGAGKRREVGRKLAAELIAHNQAESQTLYKRLMKSGDFCAQVDKHQREHEEVNTQLTSLLNGNSEDAEWLNRVALIRKAVEAHFDDEENQLMPQARKLLARREAKALADEFIYLRDLRMNLMQPV